MGLLRGADVGAELGFMRALALVTMEVAALEASLPASGSETSLINSSRRSDSETAQAGAGGDSESDFPPEGPGHGQGGGGALPLGGRLPLTKAAVPESCSRSQASRASIQRRIPQLGCELVQLIDSIKVTNDKVLANPSVEDSTESDSFLRARTRFKLLATLTRIPPEARSLFVAPPAAL